MKSKFTFGDIVSYKGVAYEVVDFMAVGSGYDYVYDLKEVDGDGEYMDREENELTLVKAVDGRDKGESEQLFIVRVTDTNNATGDFDSYNAPFVFKTKESAWVWIDKEVEANKSLATEGLNETEIEEIVTYEKFDMDSILDVDGRRFGFEILYVSMKD